MNALDTALAILSADAQGCATALNRAGDAEGCEVFEALADMLAGMVHRRRSPLWSLLAKRVSGKVVPAADHRLRGQAKMLAYVLMMPHDGVSRYEACKRVAVLSGLSEAAFRNDVAEAVETDGEIKPTPAGDELRHNFAGLEAVLSRAGKADAMESVLCTEIRQMRAALGSEESTLALEKVIRSAPSAAFLEMLAEASQALADTPERRKAQ